MKKILSILLGASLAMGAGAAETLPNMVTGVDNLSCREWNEARHAMAQPGGSKTRGVYVAWVQGFMQGMNTHRILTQPGRSTADLPFLPLIKMKIDDHCAEKPGDLVRLPAALIFQDATLGSK